MVHSTDIESRLGFTNSNALTKQTIAPMDNANYSAVVSIHLTIIIKAK
jgi:hypothetical protein